MTLKAERYRCLSCGQEWRGAKGPQVCPRCEGLYVKWLTYNQTQEETDVDDRKNP